MDLEQAILNRLHVKFTYDGHPRVVQPGAYGPHINTGNMSLRGYQVAGTSSSRTAPFWTMFTVAHISDLVITDETFADNPPGYTKGDAHISPIIAEL